MRDRFVGDIGDFGKYGLLRALCGVSPCDSRKKLSLGIVWYFNPDDRGVGGNRLEYLLNPARFRPCDPALFHALFWIVLTNHRDVTRIGDSDIFPRDTVFFPDPVPTQLEKRKAWADHASEKTKHCDLVFLDPDNGLRADPPMGDKVRPQYVYYKDLDPFLRQSRALVIYHDLGRVRKNAEKAEIELHSHELRNRGNIVGDIWALRWGTVARRAYFIIPNGRDTELEPRIKTLLSGRWRQHFQPLRFP